MSPERCRDFDAQKGRESKLILIGTEKSRDGYPVALLARQNGARLDYAGAAGFALPGDEGAILRERTAALRTDRPAIAELAGRQRVRWVKPLLTVRVRHLKGEEMLRHATVRELLI